MAKKKTPEHKGELVAVQPTTEVTVRPPDSGVVGSFLDNVRNTFKARGMRMNGLMKRIDESGQRMEGLLRMAAEKAESAESRLQQDLMKEGLAIEVSAEDEEE